MFFNDTLPFMAPTLGKNTPLHPAIGRVKYSMPYFYFEEGISQSISPTQYTYQMTSFEILLLTTHAFFLFESFSLMSLSVANGPFAPVYFECLCNIMNSFHIG
jgi:hypothetical protein